MIVVLGEIGERNYLLIIKGKKIIIFTPFCEKMVNNIKNRYQFSLMPSKTVQNELFHCHSVNLLFRKTKKTDENFFLFVNIF